MTLSLAAIPRQPLDAGGPRRGRRIGPRLAASAIVHLALVVLVVLFATRRPPEPATQAPPSFQLMLAPGPTGRPDAKTLSRSQPATAAPPKPEAPPVPPPPPPPAAAPPRPAPPPPPAAALPRLAAPALPRTVAPQSVPPQTVPQTSLPATALPRLASPPSPPATAQPQQALPAPPMPSVLVPGSLPPVAPPPALATPDATTPLANAVPPRPLLLPPAIPAPAPPGPVEAPPVRLALTLPPADNLVPLPDPVPIPEPDAAPEPLPEPASPPRPPTPRPPAAPQRMDLTLGQDFTGTLEPPDPAKTEGMIHVRGADVSDDWKEQLSHWWLQHSYYPQEAIRRQQHGTVKILVRIDHDGHVRMVQLENPSGSQWLDAGAQAVFRGQTVPALPASSTEPEKEIDVTIDYVLVRRR